LRILSDMRADAEYRDGNPWGERPTDRHEETAWRVGFRRRPLHVGATHNRSPDESPVYSRMGGPLSGCQRRGSTETLVVTTPSCWSRDF
jgi:hypothetical protein